MDTFTSVITQLLSEFAIMITTPAWTDILVMHTCIIVLSDSFERFQQGIFTNLTCIYERSDGASQMYDYDFDDDATSGYGLERLLIPILLSVMCA